jgi:outer membrane protein assembly factor BamB
MRTLLALLLFAPFAAAEDWPQFLGPRRDSSSPAKVAPWKGDLKTVWKKPIGEAHSSPVVANGVVYAFFKPKGKEADALAAFDAATGELKWEKSYDREKFEPKFGAGPRGTPSVDGGNVYTLGNTGVLACWNAKDGDIVWKVDTLKEFQAKNLFFGVSTSPTVVGKLVVVMVGGKGAGIVAFDKLTGKTVWQATDDTASYASPIVVGEKGKESLVFLTGANVLAVDAATGKELWKLPFVDKLLESSTTPVKLGDTYIVGSVTVGSIGVTVADAMPNQVWKNDKLTCYFSTPVGAGDYCYMVNGAATLKNASITLRCVEPATGKVAWEKPNVGKYHAAIIRTGDGKLLMLDDKGYLNLFEPDPKEYKELARSKVCGETWAHPALVGGMLYLRDDKDLICVEVGGK